MTALSEPSTRWQFMYAFYTLEACSHQKKGTIVSSLNTPNPCNLIVSLALNIGNISQNAVGKKRRCTQRPAATR
jgi:hypothetical protein